MKRILFLIPILFISVKPYNQIQPKEVNINTDTLILSKVHDSISMELARSKELDEKRAELLNELSKLKKKKVKRKEKNVNLDKLKVAMEKYNNRGI